MTTAIKLTNLQNQYHVNQWRDFQTEVQSVWEEKALKAASKGLNRISFHVPITIDYFVKPIFEEMKKYFFENHGIFIVYCKDAYILYLCWSKEALNDVILGLRGRYYDIYK